QIRGQTRLSRLVHIAKATLLPIVLTARTMREMAGSGRLMRRLPVLFWLVLMQSAWALGEALGALAGAGKSLNDGPRCVLVWTPPAGGIDVASVDSRAGCCQRCSPRHEAIATASSSISRPNQRCSIGMCGSSKLRPLAQ